MSATAEAEAECAAAAARARAAASPTASSTANSANRSSCRNAVGPSQSADNAISKRYKQTARGRQMRSRAVLHRNPTGEQIDTDIAAQSHRLQKAARAADESVFDAAADVIHRSFLDQRQPFM